MHNPLEAESPTERRSRHTTSLPRMRLKSRLRKLRRDFPAARLSRVLIALILVLLGAAVSTFAVEAIATLRVAENGLTDLRIAGFAPPRPVDPNIVVVVIDDNTMRPLPYRSPLDRGLLSDLLLELQRKDVLAIGLNVLVDRPTEPDKDDMLRRTLRNLDVPVVLANLSEDPGPHAPANEYAERFGAGFERGLSVVFRDRLDETVRHVLLRREANNGRQQLGFAAALARALGLPLPSGERLTIDFRLGPDAGTPPFALFPAHLLAQVPASFFKGRVVLVGADLELVSRHRTPLSGVPGGQHMPGVLIEAHALSQIIERRSLRQVGIQGTYLLCVIAALLGALVAVARVGLWWKVWIALATLPVGWFVIFYFYVDGRLLLPIMAPTLAFLLAAVGSFTWQWRGEHVRRRYIHGAFGRFLAPTVVEQLINDPHSLGQGGESREITFLFTDVEDFTALTERISPEALIALVNEYLDHACRIVIEHGGTIDKIVGDALHVMFNAPLLQEDHHQRAVECGLALDSWARVFAERKHGEGVALGRTRIGINTGTAVVGNFGGARRFDYTAHGDAINTAARLEGVNKRLGTRLCVSHTTVEHCTGIRFRPIGELVLRGKTQGVMAYTPVAAGEAHDEVALASYQEAFELLQSASPRAAAAFTRLLESYPDDVLVRLHHERLAGGDTDARIVIRRK